MKLYWFRRAVQNPHQFMQRIQGDFTQYSFVYVFYG